MQMEHVHWDIGGAAFWLFIAAAVASSTWAKSRRESEKHETLRRVMEKTGKVDESTLKELFSAPASPDWDWMKSKPGDGYRALRIAGAIVMSIAGGIALCFLVLGQTAVIPRMGSVIGMSIACGFAVFGLGLFVSSRFAEPPPDKGNGPTR
jgi:hypothetical protein